VWELAEAASSRVNEEPPAGGIGKLPPELLTTVFSFLDNLQLIRCLGVCRYWRNTLSNSTTLWPSYILVNNHEGYRGNEDYDVDGISVSDPKLVRSFCERLSNLGNVKELKMDSIFQQEKLMSSFSRTFHHWRSYA
jgi:hypothetical protein